MRILLTEEQLREGVERLARQLNEEYEKRPLTIIGILTGSVMLLADVVRQLQMPLRVGVIQTSSYRDGITRGKLKINASMMLDIRGRDVILVDDIFDTGHTLLNVIDSIQEFGPNSVKSAVLLSKTGRCEVDIQPDYSMFDIPDEFVVGYGLDYRDEYRNLPYLAVLESDDLVDETK